MHMIGAPYSDDEDDADVGDDDDDKDLPLTSRPARECFNCNSVLHGFTDCPEPLNPKVCRVNGAPLLLMLRCADYPGQSAEVSRRQRRRLHGQVCAYYHSHACAHRITGITTTTGVMSHIMRVCVLISLSSADTRMKQFAHIQPGRYSTAFKQALGLRSLRTPPLHIVLF